MASQREEIERLAEECRQLRDAVRYLSYCKKSIDEYMFFDWLVRNDVFGDRRVRLDNTLLVLGARLEGEELTKKPDISGVPRDLLYRDGPPTYDDARIILMAALDVRNESIVTDLFEALRRQGLHRKLAELANGS